MISDATNEESNVGQRRPEVRDGMVMKGGLIPRRPPPPPEVVDSPPQRPLNMSKDHELNNEENTLNERLMTETQRQATRIEELEQNLDISRNTLDGVVQRLSNAQARIIQLEATLIAIVESDWVALLAFGGPSDDYDFRTPESFHTEGIYETDARYVYPEREALVRRAASDVLGDARP